MRRETKSCWRDTDGDGRVSPGSREVTSSTRKLLDVDVGDAGRGNGSWAMCKSRRYDDGAVQDTTAAATH